ncbi:hypothetical protein GCM10009765_52520 [Fodinicola feengrottensis]|uniref:N-acetyltransferase domain-containing protein n=1 Tax=Fodinicola feengrottensis TaxID=435914 RepID=A0ABP4U057_9ACTN
MTDQATSLQLAVHNAATFWCALGETRGNQIVRRPGFLCVHGSERGGMRMMVLSAEPSSDDLAELTALIKGRADGKVTVEDAFGVVDLSALGLTSRQLPVMIRQPGAALPPSSLEVTRVELPEQLEQAERTVVHGFALENFQPYQLGQVFPASLLARDGIDLFLISRDGTLAGACMTVADGSVGGVYWVTTLPEHRSRGVGRELMYAVLAYLKDQPVTLSASRAGKPLYDSLGFTEIASSTWWA